MRVLLAEDEAVFSEYVSATLKAQGWEVDTASTGHEAIDLGVLRRPDVLIADWLLKNRYHGLDVSNALSTLDPEVKTILITGFGSADLRGEAEAAGVFRFLEKPMPLKEIVNAVQNASMVDSDTGQRGLIPVITVDGDGAVQHANDRAKELFESVGFGSAEKSLTSLFDDNALQAVLGSTDRWVEVSPQSRRNIKWSVRSRRVGPVTVIVILPEERVFLKDYPAMRPLLGLQREPDGAWPYDQHVLIVDRFHVIRRVYPEQLEARGCKCYAADTPDLALKLVKGDPKIGIVVMEFDWPDTDLTHYVREIRRIRPNIKLIGTSVGDHQDGFAMRGVDLFLYKPWSVDQLLELLSQQNR